ncbi:MAG: FAD binding domain-containing protein [Planctomycetaceae bacterium]|nr:FAD binding domain-containing protein [Planctomycetaceae bacterium]
MKIEMTVNGEKRTVKTTPLARLLDVIRDDMNLKGCKEGCGEGECGACSIILNGRLVNACMVPAIQASGADIETIEGLGEEDRLDPLQQAFIDEGAVHCGFCTPGMIMAARCLLEDNAKPSRLEIKTALSGNLCRCTGYDRIVSAVSKAVDDGYRPAKSGGGKKASPEFEGDEKDRYFSPASLAEALDILAKKPDILLLSGNTDIGPEMKEGKLKPIAAMDIFTIPELKRIRRDGDVIRIGACTTNTDIMESDLVRDLLPALYQASCSCAAPAIRNRATIGGNCCTASGAADLPGALFALGAKARVVSKKGERIMEAPEFIKAYRKPDLQPGEILAELIIPIPPKNAYQRFFKRGSRAALTLSRVSLAVYVELEDGVVTACRAAAGSMSPTPIRLPKLEATLIGKKLDKICIECAVDTVYNELTPRKSAVYRKNLSSNLVRRFLESLIKENEKN